MKILFATDGSQYSERAAGFLAKLPHENPIELTILSVFEPVELHGSQEIVTWMDDHAKAAKQECQSACDRVARMFEGANVTVKTKVLDGHAGREITSEAHASDVDLVVIGAQGHSLAHRMLLGSVSDFVGTHAHCSVLVIRPNDLEKNKPEEFRVCLAYDHSEPAQYAIREIQEFGWQKSTHFDVVSIMNTAYTDMYEPVIIDMEPVREALQERADEAVKALSAAASDVTSHVIEGNHTGYKISDYAKKTSADLLVVGDSCSGLVSKFLLGSVSRYVLRHSNCSVWIAREKQAKQE